MHLSKHKPNLKYKDLFFPAKKAAKKEESEEDEDSDDDEESDDDFVKKSGATAANKPIPAAKSATNGTGDSGEVSIYLLYMSAAKDHFLYNLDGFVMMIFMHKIM